MIFSIVYVVLFCLISQSTGYSLEDLAPKPKDGQSKAAGIRSGPINNCFVEGSPAKMLCVAQDASSRIFWDEYATGNPSGNPISDGTGILPGAPNASRYHMTQEGDPLTFNLNINSSLLLDGGRYQCYESNSQISYFAEMIILKSNPNCTTTIPADGIVLEGQKFTVTCTVVYEGIVAPIMTWTGPTGFTSQGSTTNTTVTSTITFTASREMSGAQYVHKTNFTDVGFQKLAGNNATNAPAYSYTFVAPTLNVYISSGENSGGSASYIRWGRNVCAGQAKALYKGYAAGNYYSSSGGGGDYLCLPETPQWGNTIPGYSSYGASLYGVEYEIDPAGSVFSNANNGGTSINNYDAVCVLCNVANRTSSVMLPAHTSCPPNWNLEYTGYLVAQSFASQYRNVHVCVDATPEVIPGSGASVLGAGFYTVQARCGPLPCPSYTDGNEVNCAVCTY